MRRPYSLYALQFYKKRRGTSDGGVGPLGPMRWLCSLHALRKKGNKSGRQWKKRTKLGRCNSLRFERSAGQHAGQHAAGYSHCHTHKHTHTPACRLIWPICETWNSMLCRLQPHTHTHTHAHKYTPKRRLLWKVHQQDTSSEGHTLKKSRDGRHVKRNRRATL